MDGLKGYVALVSGLTEATAARAREVATALLAQGGIQAVPSGAAAMATQITGLAEDLLVTARDNRGALIEVVRTEAERAVATLGVVTTAEADALRRRIAELENELAQVRAAAVLAPERTAVTRARRTTPRTPASSTEPPPSPATVQRVVAKKAATTKKATAKKATAKKAAKKTTATKAAAKKATATEGHREEGHRHEGRSRDRGPVTESAPLPQRAPVAEVDRTGDDAVDAALAELDALDDQLDPAEQLPVLAAVHEALQQRLSSTEG